MTCSATFHPTPGTDLGAPIACTLEPHDASVAHRGIIDGEPRPGVVTW